MHAENSNYQGYLSVRANLTPKVLNGQTPPRGLCHAVNILGNNIVSSYGSWPADLDKVSFNVANACLGAHSITINGVFVDPSPKSR